MNKIILSLCLVLIALMGIASVSACDVDNCTVNDTAPFGLEQYGIDNSSANGTINDVDEYVVDNSSANGTINDVDEYVVDNSSADDEFPYDLEQYGIDNCPADGKTPYIVDEHIYYDYENRYWVMDHELYEYCCEVIWYFNEDEVIEIFAHELGISEHDACRVYNAWTSYYEIVEEIAPPDEYDRIIIYG